MGEFINRADDHYAVGFRLMPARDVQEGDEYLASYVEQAIVIRCQDRQDLGNGYVSLDGTYWQYDFPLWVRKHEQ